MTLERLALSRSTLDRAAHRRTEPGLTQTLLADQGTVVLTLSADRALVEDRPSGPRLVLGRGGCGPAADALVAFLGVDGAGTPHLLVAGPRVEDGERPAHARWAGLREVGQLLDDTGAGLLTTSVALANWHATHPRCARCGQPSDVVQSGWARQCPRCGAEHYPRTDPAVIMTVVDDHDRLLLGRQVVWPPRRYSTLAGFVEPGESLEAAVRREVREEVGVVVGDVTYLGSQPWPFPASIMLGYQARATTTDVQVDGVELAQAQWWTREELALDCATGELLLPPGVSIARRLIEHWYGGAITDSGEAWR